MEEDDPFASIIETCNRGRCEEAHRRYTALLLPPPEVTTSSFSDEYSSRDAIPAHSIVNFFCSINPDTTSHVNEYDTPIHPPRNEYDDTPFCVVSFEDSPPPTPEYCLLGTSHDFQVDGEDESLTVDCSCSDDGDPREGGLGLWLSKLKSTAISQEPISDFDVSFLTKFRVFVSPFKRENRGPSKSKSKGRKVSVSVSVLGKRPSKKQRNYSETNKLGLGSNIWLLLLKLKSIAKFEAFFPEVVPFFSKLRAEHWVSERQPPSKDKTVAQSLNSKAKKRLLSVPGMPASKKLKQAVIVLSDTEEEEEEEVGTSGVLGLGPGHQTLSNGMPLKESQVGGSKPDRSHANLLGSSNDVRSCKVTDSKRCPAEFVDRHEWDYSICAAAEENAATPGPMGSAGRSSNAFQTLAFTLCR